MSGSKGRIISIANRAADLVSRQVDKIQIAVNTNRKGPVYEYGEIPSEVKRSMTTRIECHGAGIRTVARDNGVSYNDVALSIIEVKEREKRDAYEKGFRAGQRNPLFPTTPTSQRRAA